MPEQPPAAAWSVWPTGQHNETTQLHTRGYLPATRTDAERIPPALAAYAINYYSRPGDTVLDPDCGTGTVLVEALRAGRHTVGLTTSDRRWNITRANLTATKLIGAWPDASVLDAYPRMLTTPRAAGLTGRVDLVLTTLRHHPTGRADPGEAGPGLSRLAQTLTACIPLLRPTAHVIITIRRRRSRGILEDLPSAVLTAGHTAGLIPLQRCIALTTPLRGTLLTQTAPHPPKTTIPISLTAHHDVLIFGAPEHRAVRRRQERPHPRHADTDSTADSAPGCEWVPRQQTSGIKHPFHRPHRSAAGHGPHPAGHRGAAGQGTNVPQSTLGAVRSPTNQTRSAHYLAAVGSALPAPDDVPHRRS
ncbi:MAG: hypothetical protein JO281_20115 [Pseudonocardiales bacterium]|nr:hypothetical protein [Pseudonocardiales bacterium]